MILGMLLSSVPSEPGVQLTSASSPPPPLSHDHAAALGVPVVLDQEGQESSRPNAQSLSTSSMPDGKAADLMLTTSDAASTRAQVVDATVREPVLTTSDAARSDLTGAYTNIVMDGGAE